MNDPTLTLRSDAASVTLHPGRGADIRAFVDRASGVNVLFERRVPSGVHASSEATSWQHFHAGYPGGWQVLLPNAGDACDVDGAPWPFHGEACQVAWQVDQRDESSATLTTCLATVPVTVTRTVTLRGRTLRVEETVRNVSAEDVDVMWVHHPAFGAPLVAPGTRLYTGARRFTVDHASPELGLQPGTAHPWPAVATTTGATVNLSVVPSKDQPRALLGYLSEFTEPFYALVNAGLGLGVALRWDDTVFPHAWLWQELCASPGFPWFRTAYVMAVEPATTVPARGLVAARAAGGTPLTVAAGGRRTAVVEATLFSDTRPVRSVLPGGRIEFTADAVAACDGQSVEEVHS